MENCATELSAPANIHRPRPTRSSSEDTPPRTKTAREGRRGGRTDCERAERREHHAEKATEGLVKFPAGPVTTALHPVAHSQPTSLPLAFSAFASLFCIAYDDHIVRPASASSTPSHQRHNPSIPNPKKLNIHPQRKKVLFLPQNRRNNRPRLPKNKQT